MSSEQERLLAIITRESKRLSDTLNQFLYQARPTLTRSPVDLGRLIAEAVTLLRNGPEVGPAHHGGLRGGRRAARVPGRPRPDPAGLLEPDAQRARGHARGRHALGAAGHRRRGGRCSVVARPGPRHGPRGAAARVRAVPVRDRPWAPASGSRSSTASCASTRRHHGASTPARGTEVEVRLPRSRCPLRPDASAARYGPQQQADQRPDRASSRRCPRPPRAGSRSSPPRGGPPARARRGTARWRARSARARRRPSLASPGRTPRSPPGSRGARVRLDAQPVGVAEPVDAPGPGNRVDRPGVGPSPVQHDLAARGSKSAEAIRRIASSSWRHGSAVPTT